MTDATVTVPKTKGRSSAYPRYNFQKAEELATETFKQGARKCDPDIIAKAVGYSNAKNGAYKALRAAANQFGLVNYEGSSSISVEEIWIDAFHSEDKNKLAKARKQSRQEPNLYQQIIEEYKDRQLPQLDKLSRELHLNPKYGILQDAAETAAKVFLESAESAEYAGIIDSNRYIVLESNLSKENSTTVEEVLQNSQSQNTTVEEAKDCYSNEDRQKGKNNINSVNNHVHSVEGLEKYEITLVNQEKAYIYVTVPLPFGEKDRLKKYIDLILEDAPSSSKIFEHSLSENLEQKSLWD